MRLRAIALALLFSGCDATFAYTEPTDSGASEAAAVTCVTAGCLAPLQCDTKTGLCERCIVDGDCPDDRPRCRLDVHQCVRCIDALDCPGPIDQCLEHHCVQGCTGSTPFECKVPTKCDPFRSICVQCIDDHDCMMPPRTICAKTYGRCEECLSDSDCPTLDHHHCLVARHSCVECVYASDCPKDRPQCTVDNHCIAL
jgi:hypothetical protein